MRLRGLGARIPRPSRSHLRDLLLVGLLVTARPGAMGWAVGLTLFALALGFRLWAKATLRRNQELTVDGPYALCRHPFYLGNLLLDVSMCVMAGHPLVGVLYVPIFAWVYRPTIRREEEYLEARFPGLWGEVAQRPALLPRLPRRWRDLGATWSVRVLADEREWSRSLRLIALPLLIATAGEVTEGGWLELAEWECLSLLATAAALHVAARMVYQMLERAGHRFAWRSLELTGALAALCGAAAVMSVVVPGLQGRQAQSLGHRYEAIVVSSSAQWRSLWGAAVARGPFLLDDEVMKEIGRAGRQPGLNDRAIWSRFEVYHLLDGHSVLPGKADARIGSPAP